MLVQVLREEHKDLDQASTRSALLVSCDDIEVKKVLSQSLCQDYRCLSFSSDPYALGADDKIATQVVSELKEHSERWVQGFAYGDGASVIQLLAQRAPKLMRRVVLLNGTTSIAPSSLDTFISKVESYIPCGLPLRSKGLRHDTRALLHRIHCPCLIVLTQDASAYARSQGHFMHERVPNSWLVEMSESLHSKDFGKKLLEHMSTFEKIPAKSPQKNLGK